MIKHYLPAIINNPIILRESTSRMRRFSSFVFLGLVLFGAYLLITFNWTVIYQHYSNRSVQSNEIRTIFQIYNLILFVGVACFIPFMSAIAINGEKERDTWDLLITTPINSISILVGKLTSTLFFTILILFAVFPFYGIFFLLGSVTFREVLFMYSLFVEGTMILALIGMICSCWLKRTIQSVTMTYVIGAVYIIGFAFFEAIIRTYFRTSGDLSFVQLLSPLMISGVHFWGPGPFRHLSRTADIHYPIHFGLNACLIVFLLVVCIQCFYLPKLYNPFQGISIKQLNFNSDRITSWLSWFTPKHNIRDGANIIWNKDYRLMYQTRSNWISLLCIGLIGYLVFHAGVFNSFRNDVRENIALLLIGVIFTPFSIIPYAANCLRSEQDRDTLDILLTSAIPIRSIILGKLLTGMQIFLYRFVAFAALPYLLVYMISSTGQIPQMLLISITLLSFLTALFILTSSMLISIVSKSTINAYAWTGVLTVILYFGTPIVSSIIITSLNLSPREALGLIHIIRATSPLGLIFVELYDVLDQYIMFSGFFVLFQCIALGVFSHVCFSLSVSLLEDKRR